jgi:hypothetical protein
MGAAGDAGVFGSGDGVDDATCAGGAVTGISGSGGDTDVGSGEGAKAGTAESTALPCLAAGWRRDIGFRERLPGRRSRVMKILPGSSPPPG